jgi:hypothetical protein
VASKNGLTPTVPAEELARIICCDRGANRNGRAHIDQARVQTRVPLRGPGFAEDRPRRALQSRPDTVMLDVSRVAAPPRPAVQQAAIIYLRQTQPWFVGLLIHGLALKGGFNSISLTRFLDQRLALSGKVHVRFVVARHVHQSSVQRVPFRPRGDDAMDDQSPESDAQPVPVLIVGGGLVGLSMSQIHPLYEVEAQVLQHWEETNCFSGFS